MTITAEILGTEVFKAKLAKMRKGSPVYTAVEEATTLVQARVMKEKLSGQVLKVRTGKLRRSITQKIDRDTGSISGIVGTNTRYARIHEFGGVIKYPPREMLIRHRLTYRVGEMVSREGVRGGKSWVDEQGRKIGLLSQTSDKHLARFAKKSHKFVREMIVTTKGHEVHMPERSFLRSSLRDLTPDIKQMLYKAIRQTMEGK